MPPRPKSKPAASAVSGRLCVYLRALDVDIDGGRREREEDVRQLCWHCCHPFDTVPLHYPFAYLERTDEFRVGGAFCSWECMRRYGDTVPHRRASVPIAYFHKRVVGHTKHIRSAPPRCVLKAFGGHMSIREFRENSTPHTYEVTLDRMVQVVPYATSSNTRGILPDLMASFENMHRADPTAAKEPARVDFSGETVKNEALRISRPTPLTHTSRNTIERALGLNSLIKRRKK